MDTELAVSDPAQAEEGVEGLQRVALRDLGQGPRTDKMSQKVSSLVSYGQSSAKPPWRDNTAFLQSASLCLTTLLALPRSSCTESGMQLLSRNTLFSLKADV